MKQTINHIVGVFLGLALFVSASCEKKVTELPERELPPDVAEIAASYVDVLTEAPNGWVLSYQPDQFEEIIYIHLTFKDNAHVDILSGYRGYHTLQHDMSYHFEGNHLPHIVFEGENVFQTLAEAYNGIWKFKITQETGDRFKFVRSDGFNNREFFLEKADTENLALLQAQIDGVLDEIAWEEEQARLSEETRLKVHRFFEIESDFYFYNLQTANFSAAIESFDTVARALTLTYKAREISSPTTVTVHYQLYPNGIVLSPALDVENVLIDTLELGEFDDANAPTSLAILRAGNDGPGNMGYMHTPPYAYTLVSNRAISTSEFLLDPAQQNRPGSGSGLYLYTAHPDENYSPMVNQLRSVFGNYLEAHVPNVRASTRLVSQIYFPENPATSRNIQISTHRNPQPPNNLFFLYRIALELGPEENSDLLVHLTEPTGTTVAHKAAFDDYLNPQFPSEGVTVVPVIVGTTTRFRLVSRQDSRYWIEYVVNVAADRSLRFD